MQHATFEEVNGVPLAWEVWKLASKVEGDMLKIVLFEVSVVALMEMNEDGHDFARVHRE